MVGDIWSLLTRKRPAASVAYWHYLTACRAVLAEVSRRTTDEQALIAEHWSRVDGVSFAGIASRVGVSRTRAQQLVEQGRAFRIAEGETDA
jgi:putative heme degradation protein